MPKVIRDAMGLSERERRFVECYCKTSDRMQAVAAAGYNSKNRAEIGWQLLQKPHVQRAVRHFTHQALAELSVDLERANHETACIAFNDPGAFFREDGTLKNPIEWDGAAAAAVASLTVKEIFEYEGTGENRRKVLRGYIKRLRFWDKNAALERLTKQLLGSRKEQDQSKLPLVAFHFHGVRPPIPGTPADTHDQTPASLPPANP